MQFALAEGPVTVRDDCMLRWAVQPRNAKMTLRAQQGAASRGQQAGGRVARAKIAQCPLLPNSPRLCLIDISLDFDICRIWAMGEVMLSPLAGDQGRCGLSIGLCRAGLVSQCRENAGQYYQSTFPSDKKTYHLHLLGYLPGFCSLGVCSLSRSLQRTLLPLLLATLWHCANSFFFFFFFYLHIRVIKSSTMSAIAPNLP